MIFFFGKSAIKMCVDITFLIQKNSAILTSKKYTHQRTQNTTNIEGEGH